MDWISIAGTTGTFGFGILSLYQWTTLTALRKAIRAHAQTAYNNFWSVGNEMEQLIKAVTPSQTQIDWPTILKRSAAANSTSLAARHETTNFSRYCAGFVPKYEQAWNPDPIPERRKFWKEIFKVFGN
jgi:hypothetical protein